MLNQTFTSAMTSLAPFWSNQMVQGFQLGNEYNMAINLILTETIKFLSVFLTEKNTIYLITLIIIGFSLTKFSDIRLDFIFQPIRSVSINCAKDDYSEVFLAVNQYLIEKYKIFNLKKSGHDKAVELLDKMKKTRLDLDLYVTVEDSSSGNTLTLSSYRRDLSDFIEKAIQNYRKYEYRILFEGKESNGEYEYSQIMSHLTKYFIHKYGIKYLKVLKKKISPGEAKQDFYEEYQKENKKQPAHAEIETDRDQILLIDDCTDYELEKDIYLDVVRTPGKVLYRIKSRDICLKKFINNCILDLDRTIMEGSMEKFKYTVKFVGTANKVDYRDEVQIFFPSEMMDVISVLENKGIIKDFLIISSGKKIDFRIPGSMDRKFVDGIYISVQNLVDTGRNSSHIAILKLESNEVNLSKFIKECSDFKLQESIRKNKDILYYFKYTGSENGDPQFSKRTLSSKDNPNCETFDCLYHRHVPMLKKDLDQLNDIEYYKRTGSRRKKSYLFHGEPGCGKNSTVTAMALYSNRHIIEVPFGSLKTGKELDAIMNLTKIDDVAFNKNEIILIFDEMDIGLNKILADKKEGVPEQQINITLSEDKVPRKPSQTDSRIDLSAILSNLDGFGNYGGIVIVGLTNNLDSIPEPLKRPMRLNPIYFTYLRKVDAINMIERFHQITLKDKYKDQLEDNKIVPSRLRYLCEKYSDDDLDLLFSELNEDIEIH